MLITAILLIAVVLILASVLSVSDNLIQIEAKKQGIDTQKTNMSLYPRISELFGKSAPSFASSSKFHQLRKGHDIKLSGGAEGPVMKGLSTRYAIKPTDYRGIAPIPKMLVAEGDEVKAGDEIFYDKQSPEVKFVAPVSGEIVEVRRGAKRAITHIVILADKEQTYRQHDILNVDTASRDDIVNFLKMSGAWTLLEQRPYNVMADPDIIPDNIFISTFDTSPLAHNSTVTLDGRTADVQMAVDTLSRLTSGKVYLGLDGRGNPPHAALTSVDGAELHYFRGKHPAGNVGVQIHHTAPIGKGTVWTLTLDNLLTLGRLMNAGVYDTSRIIALAGAQFEEPSLVKTQAGASISELTKGNLKTESKTRLILGDVLSGKTVGEDDFIGINTNLVTSIKEGDEYELFGWLLPIKPRPSISRTMPGFLMPNLQYEANTNTHGEKRAFVVTGQYEKMLPMDIYPQQLMKAIMAGDIERMEGLGINELSEEDIALAEFACTSKMPLQEILRDGLDMMREQG